MRMRAAEADVATEDPDRPWSALMTAAQDGDSTAYARLLREILPYLRALVRRLGQHPNEVEDVVQDILLTIHRVRHTYDPALPFTPWIATIARRRAIDQRRRTGRVGAWETADSDTIETFVDVYANRRAEVRELRQWLAQVLGELPPKQREALELVKFRELSVAEAAAASGQSPGAIKVNTHRALRTLRRLWDRETT
jgi:RNA polymerase sigma-70 factor (ECF subfamily)